MSDALTIAEHQLLSPTGLGHADLERVLKHLMGSSVDAGDLYFQTVRNEAWSLEDGRVSNGSFSTEQGVGIRALSGEKTGFAYADELVMPALMQASGSARAIADSGGGKSVQAWKKHDQSALYLPDDPMTAMPASVKVDLLRQIDTYARSLDSRVNQVMASLSASHETILVASTDGTLAADVRPLVRVSIAVIAEQNGRREQGSDGGGGRYSYEQLLKDNAWQGFADEAVRQPVP
jgi:TldD protein